jgi:Polyketide cyclase / dehydrase and lipid transport
MKKRFQVELDISAEHAWIAIGEKFGETGQWTSLLDSSHLEGELTEGGYRVCIQGKKRLTENITRYDPENMTLEYELITGRPPIVKSAKNFWSVKSLEKNRSKVLMCPDIELKWWAIWLFPMMSLGLNASLSKVMEELKYWAETGNVHPRKKAK